MKHLSSKLRSPFLRVLFATNCSADYEGALESAFRFCQANQASLRILHVAKTQGSSSGESGTAAERGASLMLRQMRERAIGLGIPCTSRLEVGVPSQKILEAIQGGQVDLVVLGTSELRGSKCGVLGPTAEQVMLKTCCPIMTVGPVAADLGPSNSSAGPVVFATDFHSVTRQAIHVAVCYCKSLDLQLHCLHVLPRTLQSSNGDHTLPEILTYALKHLVATSAAAIEKPVFSVTYGSEISNSVVDYCRQQGASLIFLGVRRDSIFSPNDPVPIVFRIIT
ncbi:MAG: universal stress protein, partial [Acidobacteriota bacterium]|nr:universal stress protein [Acidobacteriota bacterium]